jgi:hypothetical protein
MLSVPPIGWAINDMFYKNKSNDYLSTVHRSKTKIIVHKAAIHLIVR